MIESIGVIITALSGLLLTLGQILASREKKRVVDSRELGLELDTRNQQILMAKRHISLLERTMADAPVDLVIPIRPYQLAADWDGKEHTKEVERT